jgi:hypothetical protein
MAPSLSTFARVDWCTGSSCSAIPELCFLTELCSELTFSAFRMSTRVGNIGCASSIGKNGLGPPEPVSDPPAHTHTHTQHTEHTHAGTRTHAHSTHAQVESDHCRGTEDWFLDKVSGMHAPRQAAQIGEMMRIGVFGCPSRIVWMKPRAIAANVRCVALVMLCRLIPSLSEITSAGVSRIIRATAWSRWHCPPNPSEMRCRSASCAAVAGQVRDGEWASLQWVMLEPCVIQRGRRSTVRSTVHGPAVSKA